MPDQKCSLDIFILEAIFVYLKSEFFWAPLPFICCIWLMLCSPPAEWLFADDLALLDLGLLIRKMRNLVQWTLKVLYSSLVPVFPEQVILSPHASFPSPPLSWWIFKLSVYYCSNILFPQYPLVVILVWSPTPCWFICLRLLINVKCHSSTLCFPMCFHIHYCISQQFLSQFSLENVLLKLSFLPRLLLSKHSQPSEKISLK